MAPAGFRLLPALVPLLAPEEASALQAHLPAPAAPPAIMRAAPTSNQALLPSLLVAEADDAGEVFPGNRRSDLGAKLSGTVQGIGSAASQAAQAAAPVLQKTVVDSVPEVQKALQDASPIVEATAKELAPLGKQALDIVGPVLLKGAVELGKGTYSVVAPLAQQAGESALRAGSDAAAQASAAAGAQLQQKLGTDAESQIQQTAQGVITAAAPLVDGAVQAATPVVSDLGAKAAVEGSKLLRQGLTAAMENLDAYLGAADGATGAAAPSAVAPSAVAPVAVEP